MTKAGTVTIGFNDVVDTFDIEKDQLQDIRNKLQVPTSKAEAFKAVAIAMNIGIEKALQANGMQISEEFPEFKEPGLPDSVELSEALINRIGERATDKRQLLMNVKPFADTEIIEGEARNIIHNLTEERGDNLYRTLLPKELREFCEPVPVG